MRADARQSAGKGARRGPLITTLRGWRALLFSMAPTVALLLSGCGGSTAPSGYLCLLGRSTTDNGCYRAATWGASDETHPFFAATTDALIVPITCAGTCVTSATRDPAVSGAGASATGGVYNYLQLSQAGLGYFIRIGYGAIGGASTTYFIDYRLPIADPSTGNVTAQYRRILLSSTGVPPAPSGGYRFAEFQIMGGNSGVESSPFLQWYACLALPATSGPNEFQTPSCTLLAQGVEILPTEIGDPIANGFSPDRYSVGEHVYGSSGATAETAAFTNTQFATDPAITYDDMTGAQELHYQMSGNSVSIQSSTPAPVPFAGWITTPAESPSNGGVFYVECCTALH